MENKTKFGRLYFDNQLTDFDGKGANIVRIHCGEGHQLEWNRTKETKEEVNTEITELHFSNDEVLKS